jgi:uncharacterized protein (DUF885 family)
MSAVFDFADRLTDEAFDFDPIVQTHAGLPTDQWPDWSPDGRARVREWAGRRSAEVAALPVDDRWDRLGVMVMASDLALAEEAATPAEYRRDLNSIWSPPQRVRDAFDSMAKETDDDWELVAHRLENIGPALDGYRRSLSDGIASGDVVAARQADDVVRQLREHTRPGRFFDLLAQEGAGRAIDGAIESGRAAFLALADWLESEYLPVADPVDAVGPDRYWTGVRHSVRLGSLDLDETYAWAWDEVHRLHDRMGVVAAAITGDGIAPAYQLLKTDPDRAAHGAEAFRDFIAERLDVAQRELTGTHFDIPEPLHRLDVQVSPPGGSLGAEYRQPSEDLSRPGAVVYHPGGKDVFPLYDEVSTAYHEGFPGHHLQSGMQVYLGDRLTRFHRLLSWNSGYGEGWALYAEHLMDELGFYERPDYELGLLANQMLRACRVVVDIGLHLDKPVPTNRFGIEAWDFESAVRMLEEVAFLAPDYATSEVTRYLGWPGQAISYKVGERFILGLRDEARRTDWYTDKEFHARVVGHGPVELETLRELVL